MVSIQDQSLIVNPPFFLVNIEHNNFWFFHHFSPNTRKLTFSAEDLKCVDSCYSTRVFLYYLAVQTLEDLAKWKKIL